MTGRSSPEAAGRNDNSFHLGKIMTLEQFALIAEIVGGIGVVASLIYLAVEIRRQSRQNSLQAANELTAQWSGLMTSLHEGSEMAEIWLRGHHDFDSLDTVSKLRYGAYFERFLRNSESLYLHLQAKTLDPMVWRGIERAIRDLMILPGAQTWWRTRKHWYTDNFQNLVDEIIAKSDGEEVFARYDIQSLK
jgi:hypothetical protein